MMRPTVAWIVTALISGAALAGGGGGMTGGATEVTQLLNNAQLAQQYAQQLVAYQNQLQQYATMVQNLQKNPNGVSIASLQQLAANSAKLISYGANIGSSLASIDQNFANTFDSPTAQSYADKFAGWTASVQGSIKSTMRNAGMQREQFGDDTTALQALMTNLASSNGNLDALQALGSLNAQQIQETMKLRDLIAQQQIAQGNYIMQQTSAQASKAELDKTLQQGARDPVDWSARNDPPMGKMKK